MDLDAFIAVRKPRWERLDVLAKSRRLTGRESDELVSLYQQVATDLSVVRSRAADPGTITQLSERLLRARARIAGSRSATWSDVSRFFAVSLPAAMYRVRWWTLAVTVGVSAIAVIVAIWVANTPEGLASIGSAQERENYVYNQFASYYEPGFGFASKVWTNNAWIATQCVAFGITGLWPIWALFQNAVNIGAVAGLMAAYGELGTFFSLITPHGLLELGSVFMAGGAGLKLFWTIVDPGPRPRSLALAQEGRSLFTVAIGLSCTLLLSGIVEGFVTGTALPTWAKIVIGSAVFGAVVAYIAIFGRRAIKRGETGDLRQDEAGYSVAYAG
ncbi:stage II sporulation protein M [Rarobacter incanus]|uniref:Putative membrane protein SpoIIM required for sporulation n=1 Tax=Rarobacter incanus TaxID=153494 RepID=A0A542SNI3_9MICO|nr:stage II sporulation protein M [Rarobacter incanus]TQK76206.1 putative membrane protein SpoIIM required for sporulation [Rarobacter incanus]